MSETPEAEQPKPGLRLWPATVIIVVAGVLLAALQFAPGEAFPRQFRNFLSIVVSAAALLAMLAWLAFFSRIALWPRIALLAACAILLLIPVASIRRVEFTGDIEPSFVFRWEPDALAVLEKHRQAHADDAAPPASAAEDLAADWPGFRGPDRSGMYHGAPICDDWEEHPPQVLWKQPVGGGYAQLALAGNRAVTIEQRGPEEAVVCYDARTGRELWAYSYPSEFTEAMGGPGPRATPTIDGGHVFALGANGRLACLGLEDGKVVWQREILKDESTNASWGMAGSPLVLRNLVIVSPGATIGAQGHALVAYDRNSGDVVWSTGSAPAGYASPMVAQIDGVEQIIVLDGEGVSGYASDGSGELWRYPWETQQAINCSQPLLLPPDRVLITAGYMMGSALLEVAQNDDGKWQAEPVWKETSLRGKFSTPVVRGDYIYGLDEGILVCIDVATGQRQWKRGRYGHGQLLLVDDVLFIQAENGDLALVAADPKRYRELARIPMLEGRTWNTPALAAGRAFVRNHREMACVDLSQPAEAAAESEPESP